MELKLKINKRAIVVIIIASLIVLTLISIYIYWNNLSFSQKYKFQLEKARNVLEDEYSKEVFGYAVDLRNSYPKYFLRHKDKYLELVKRSYPELKHPNVPIHKGDTVLDGGISKNVFVEKEFYSLVGKEGRIIGLEPNEDIIPYIKGQLNEYNNVEIYPIGLWNSNTIMKMQRYNNELLNSVKVTKLEYPNKEPVDSNGEKLVMLNDFIKRTNGIKESEYIRLDKIRNINTLLMDSIDVKLVKLDDFVKEFDIKKLDYIRLDIEGSELEALMGANETLKTLKPKLCIVIDHYPETLFNIILYLDSLKLGYKFYLDVSRNRPLAFNLYTVAE